MVRRKYFGLSFEKCNCLFYTWIIFGCSITYSYTQKWILCPPPLNSRNFLSFFFNVPFICFVDKHTFNSNMFVIEVSHCYNRLYLYLMLLLATKSFKSVTNCSNGNLVPRVFLRTARGEGKTLVSAGHVSPRFWVIN
jgi:hypothetical protein